MAHIPAPEIDKVHEILLKYDIESYIITVEKDPYEHMHFLVDMSDKDYQAFAKRVFIDKYKLRGRATKDKPRQYGKVKKINSIKKALAYTIKEQVGEGMSVEFGNCIRTNLSYSVLQDIAKLSSSKKKTDTDKYKYILNYVKKVLKDKDIEIYNSDNGYSGPDPDQIFDILVKMTKEYFRKYNVLMTKRTQMKVLVELDILPIGAYIRNQWKELL